jgi:hypothetical protein
MPDRRRRPTAMFSRYTLFGGRRKACRRTHERQGAFVDQHGPVLFAVITSIVALNFLDAFFTALFLSHGGQEMNPVIDWLLGFGLWPFLIGKSLGIGVCVAFLTLTKNFAVSRGGLTIVLVGYLGLLFWHLHLLDHITH